MNYITIIIIDIQAFFFVAMVCYSAFLLTELDFIDGIQSVEIYEWIVYTYFLGDILEEYRHVVSTTNI